MCVCCVCTLIICNNKLKSVTHAIIMMLYFSLNRCHSSSNRLLLGKQHGKNDCMYMYACRPILLCAIIHFLTHTGSCGNHISNNYVSVSVGTAHIKMVSCSELLPKLHLYIFSTEPTCKLETFKKHFVSVSSSKLHDVCESLTFSPAHLYQVVVHLHANTVLVEGKYNR